MPPRSLIGGLRAILIASLLLLPACSARVEVGGAQILRGTAHSAEGAITIETDEWSYGVPLDGVAWIDEQGTRHDDGRPECLMPSEHPLPAKFAAVEVTVEGSTWRPVVWVDCRNQ